VRTSLISAEVWAVGAFDWERPWPQVLYKTGTPGVDFQLYSAYCDMEWVQDNPTFPNEDMKDRSWGDFNDDGCIDVMGHDLTPMYYGDTAGETGDGLLSAGDCAGGFDDALESWTASQLASSSYYVGGAAHEAPRWNDDWHADYMLWANATVSSVASTWWYSNDGWGDMGSALPLANTGQQVNTSTSGDFNHDGCDDVVFGASAESTDPGEVRVRFGACDGTVASESVLFDACDGCEVDDSRIHAFRWDDDNDVDIVVIYETTGGVSNIDLWDNDGAGSFSGPTNLGTTSGDHVFFPFANMDIRPSF